jgi:histidyl-tRNA synthetase
MDERHMFPESVVSRSADVMVTLWDAGGAPAALALAATLRRGGLRVDVYPEADKLAKQLKYAASRQTPFVTVVGDVERANGTVMTKNMISGDQHAVPLGELADHIRQGLGRTGPSVRSSHA